MSVVLATGGYDHTIRFWEAPSGKCTRIIKFTDSQLNRLEVTPDKQFIAAAGNSIIRVYEILSNQSNTSPQTDPVQQPALTIDGHTANVTSIGFQQEGRFLYSGSEDGTVKVWDLRNPKYCRSFDAGSAVNSVTLRTDREEFISGDANGFVKIWDFGGKGCINSLNPSSGSSGDRRSRSAFEGNVAIQAVDISEDSRTLVAVGNHGTVYAWDPSGGGAATSSTAQHYDQEQLTEDDIRIVSVLRPITRFSAFVPGEYCLHAKIAPDCRHLVTTGSNGTAKLWDTTTWELTQTLPNEKWVWDAAFCADSSYLVTASSDHVARLWNLRTGDVVRQYRGHQSAVTCVALNDSNA
ncbi:target of rapamycin complex subunit LST8 [Fistulifera solaris]|jgi:G protein beta subunit-like protein|uniref:Target of rapamycin complex subunit LST8 n=1 Tax=Fistulifera solaris TaxID=1519565 RepID=A0A1Z5KSU8_FISSO|nr:target of rapamycin complex subunit LST8 [Fistulifera solaris]|eukprot:GAX29172.1 target of rapamycin complex subunit LST8 [Fistulifera solaris]